MAGQLPRQTWKFRLNILRSQLEPETFSPSRNWQTCVPASLGDASSLLHFLQELRNEKGGQHLGATRLDNLKPRKLKGA
jgi:hypothetical protein